MSERCLSCGDLSAELICRECEPNFEDTVRMATAHQLWELGALPTNDFEPSTPFLVQVAPEEDGLVTAHLWRRGKDLPDFQLSRQAFEALPLASYSSE